MSQVQRASEIRGKTMLWKWTDGPTRGMTHEHVFHDDGTVEWRAAGAKKKDGDRKTDETKEKPEYAAMKVADGVYAVSYQAPSGFTLTVALNFHDHRMVGIASGAQEWYPVAGTFEIVQ